MKKFLLLFATYIILFFLLLEIPYIVEIFPLENFTTNLAVEATKISINLIGIEAKVSGVSFKLDNAIMMVDPDCNGLKAVILFIAVILAYPSSLKVKLVWILGSIIFLQFINIVRITFLAWTLRYHFDNFDFIHDFISPIFVISIALFMFYKYVDIANKSLEK